MKKLIFILLILAQTAALSQWKQYGSVQKINAHQGDIRDFAISKDSKFIYTVDNNGILKKWNYETGENIFAKQLQQVPGEYIPANWFFLSSDAKTYCIVNFKLKYGNDVNQFLNAYIYDINTDVLIDSINYNYLTTSLEKYYYLNCFFADYTFSQKLLTLSVNCTTYRGQYATTYTSGITSFLKKDIATWILNKKIFEYIDYWYKDSNMLFISSHNSNSNILGGTSSSEYRNSNVIYNFTDDKSQVVFSYYFKEVQPHVGKKESGRELKIKSAFFSIDKLDLFCSINDTLFRYNMNTHKLDSTRLVNDKSGKVIRIFNLPDNNLFMATQGNTISIYNTGTLDFLDQVSLPEIESINLLKYSTDGKQILFADGGYLCRMNYSDLIGVISGIDLMNFSHLTHLSINPNPCNNNTKIEFKLSRHSSIKLSIFNIQGKVIYKEPIKEYSPGYNSIPINLSRLPIGSYYYVLEANEQVYSGKIAYARE